MNSEYVFESERLRFRRWRASDRRPFSAMNADPDVMQYFPQVLTENESNLLIDRIEKHFDEKGYGLWAVERKEDSRFIGFIGLQDIHLDLAIKGSTEIGWRLDKMYWKKGYASEGARACLDYAFASLKMERIYSFTAAVNGPSEAVMKRIGMIKLKEFDHPGIAPHSPLRKHVLYVAKKGF